MKLRLRHAPWLLLIGLAIVGAQLQWERLQPHPDSYAGLPRAAAWSPALFSRVLEAPGFVIGYSEWRRNPLWVAYRLEPAQRRVGSRPERFRADHRTWVRVEPDALRGSGYDRGHMAPNFAIAKVHGRDAQLATFRMSNIVPQARPLNQKLWQRIEELEIDEYAPRLGRLWVVAGPVFAAGGERLPSGVEVPVAFYKIWLAEIDGRPSALAFLTPQGVSGFEALTEFTVSIDEIEAATGLDFFHRLADDEETELEAAVAPAVWNLDAFARRPPRY